MSWRLDRVGDRVSDKYGTIGGMRIGKGNRSTRRKPTPVSLCQPQIPHDLGRRGGRPIANHVSYATAKSDIFSVTNHHKNDGLCLMTCFFVLRLFSDAVKS
jgi:hypothetical protein